MENGFRGIQITECDKGGGDQFSLPSLMGELPVVAWWSCRRSTYLVVQVVEDGSGVKSLFKVEVAGKVVQRLELLHSC